MPVLRHYALAENWHAASAPLGSSIAFWLAEDGHRPAKDCELFLHAHLCLTPYTSLAL